MKEDLFGSREAAKGAKKSKSKSRAKLKWEWVVWWCRGWVVCNVVVLRGLGGLWCGVQRCWVVCGVVCRDVGWFATSRPRLTPGANTTRRAPLRLTPRCAVRAVGGWGVRGLG